MNTSELSCPKCGSTEKFHVFSAIEVVVDGNRKILEDDLVQCVSDGMDKNGECRCDACGHEGLYFEFQERLTGIINIP